MNNIAKSCYAKCLSARQSILNNTAQAITYGWGNRYGWSNTTIAQTILELPTRIKRQVGEIDITQLTAEQMDDLGFGTFSEDLPIRLIPLWLFPYLPTRIKVTKLDGTTEDISTEKMDTDHRGGCLAYGIYPKVQNGTADFIPI